MTSVLVTGCSSGIGAAIAMRLARAGWPVYATARRPDMLDTLREAGARTLALDVTNEDSMRSAVAVVERDHGSVGALVNNAGFGQSGALEEVPLDALRRQFDTNVFGLLRLTQLVLPGMRRARQGRIVNIGSMGGRLTFPGGGAYHATKHALVALNDALRFEVRGFGIDVVLIEPGLIRTGFADVALASLDRLEPAKPLRALQPRSRPHHDRKLRERPRRPAQWVAGGGRHRGRRGAECCAPENPLPGQLVRARLPDAAPLALRSHVGRLRAAHVPFTWCATRLTAATRSYVGPNFSSASAGRAKARPYVFAARLDLSGSSVSNTPRGAHRCCEPRSC